MIDKPIAWLATLTLLIPSAAWARDPVVQPIPIGAERISFQQGVPTMDLRQDHGAVQVTPLPMDHGRLAFRVAVHNAGPAPANIDIGSFDIHAGPQRLFAYSRQQLESQAKSRALWGTIAVAALGAVAVAASLGSDDDDDHHRRGRHHDWDDDELSSGEGLAAVSAAGAIVGGAAIQGVKEERLGALRATAMQLNTVYPNDSYAGRIVLTKLASRTLPTRVDMVVDWNGKRYPFAFQVAKQGTVQPIALVASLP